jgi:hypothetical protein
MRAAYEHAISWLLIRVTKLLEDGEFLVLLFFSGIAAALVYGSFMIMTIQALWWDWANVLDPVKVAIFAGYFVLVSHLIILIRRRSLLMTFDLVLLVASLLALWNQIRGFFSQPVFIGLGEGVLPLEVRSIVTVALFLPLVFLFVAGVSIGSAIRLRRLIRLFTQQMYKTRSRTLQELSEIRTPHKARRRRRT